MFLINKRGQNAKNRPKTTIFTAFLYEVLNFGKRQTDTSVFVSLLLLNSHKQRKNIKLLIFLVDIALEILK